MRAMNITATSNRLGMATEAVWRKAQFKAALELAGMTMGQWAEIASVTRGHLHRVLTGERESEQLIAKIDEFIRKQLMRAA
jgi:hypothetical protein